MGCHADMAPPYNAGCHLQTAHSLYCMVQQLWSLSRAQHRPNREAGLFPAIRDTGFPRVPPLSLYGRSQQPPSATTDAPCATTDRRCP